MGLTQNLVLSTFPSYSRVPIEFQELGQPLVVLLPFHTKPGLGREDKGRDRMTQLTAQCLVGSFIHFLSYLQHSIQED